MDIHHHFNIIQLNEADFITMGRHNLVYRHPTEPDYLVKVLGIVKVLGLFRKKTMLKVWSTAFKTLSGLVLQKQYDSPIDLG